MMKAWCQRCVPMVITFTSLLYLSACTPTANDVPKDKNTISTTSKPTQSQSPQTQRLAVVLEWENVQAQAMLAPQSGLIQQILVQEGQHVQAGQRLVQIQPNAITTVKRSAHQVDQAAKQQTYEQWQQTKSLFAQGFVSEAAVAKSEAAYHAASKSTVVVNTASESTQNQPPTWLQAPFNGVIKPLEVSHGNAVKNGQKLFVIEPNDTKRIKILVAQDNVHALFVGQRLHLQSLRPENDEQLWLQISELPPIEGKQYAVAYAIWPQDVTKPQSLEHYQAHLLHNVLKQP